MSSRGYIFATVGTTKFDALVRVLDSEEFAAAASAAGYSGVLVQRGAGEFVPSSARANEGTDAPAGVATAAGFWLRHYTFKPSLRRDMERAGLVISHAGAGSVLEAADLRRRALVVVNSSLMDNHQLELARKAADLGRVAIVMDPAELPKLLETAPEPPAPQPADNFGAYLSECVWGGETPKTVRAMAVLGSGGHTTEMTRCIGMLDAAAYKPRVYAIASTDRMSAHKMHQLEDTLGGLEGRDYEVHTIPRSREVGQSYITSVWTTIVAFFAALVLMWRAFPELLLCNGPGTCVPIVVAARIISFLKRRKVKIVYVESICRVKSLSLSGKVLSRLGLVDSFVVQWPELNRPPFVLRNFFFPLSPGEHSQKQQQQQHSATPAAHVD